jgi:hypothetical protein
MGVILLCRNNVTLGAKINTEVALLTKFFLYLDMSFHIISPKQFNAFDSITFGACYLAYYEKKVKYFQTKILVSGMKVFKVC